MKAILLTKGKTALVDDEDFERINQWKWCIHSGGYAYRKKYKQINVYMHRFIMSTPDGMDTDHINGNKLDNRKENLRICSTSQNRRNMKKSRGSSKYKGVVWHKEKQKWMAQIGVKEKRFLGYFVNEKEAAYAYNKAAKKYFGEFAKSNVFV